MDHHTYAKSGSKKWTAHEKRLLVTKRIECEEFFAKYSSKQMAPWKKFRDMARIGDYSERALRRQWLNMVQLYRIQKSKMAALPLSKECIDELNEEWEFFGDIHAYMNQKTNDLHSYALKQPNQEQLEQLSSIRALVNDYYFGARAKVKQEEEEHVKKNQADQTGDREPPSPPAEHAAYETESTHTYTDSDYEASSEPSDPVAIEGSDLSELEEGSSFHLMLNAGLNEQPPPSYIASSTVATSTAAAAGATAPRTRKRKALSEREKYYRHRRRYDHRMEQRIRGLCQVAGQLIEQLMPGISVMPLLKNIYNNEQYNCPSSCDEEDANEDEEFDEDN
ncbi:uncharacterized protein LOC108606685 isoform X2 [Drosophila busckii]|uniref:uncharacterized protein LOC108606685 isoform X2 n=1 Tax=Drosophila busckii TaxID=30019 RepID=UPI00083E99D5|nr:uncharacterized protein LOC108606685 isoform X2 [Drosophila busckii]